MRILMFNYEYPPLGGGAAPVTKAIAEKLVSLNHEVDVLTMGFPGLKKEEILNGVRICRIPCIRKHQGYSTSLEMLSFCISASRKLPQMIKEQDYDINHTHFIVPTGAVSSLFSKKLPFIVTAHGSDVPGYNPDRFGFQHMLIRPIWKKVIKNAACITSPTIYLKNLIRRSINYQNIIVIPNGIDASNFSPVEKQKKILVVTRLLERKGVQYVIRAMQDIEGYSLIICGDGPYREKLEKEVEELNIGDKVKLLGFVSNERLRFEYETSSIFILPSSSDNFPVVLLEAMAAGCSIITSNTTGCPEAVGNAGLFITPENVSDISEKIQYFIDNETIRADYSKKAIIRTNQDLTWDPIIKQYIRCYENALNNPHLD